MNRVITRKCGSCQLCCKLLPMRADSVRAMKLPETVSAMVQAGLARAEEFNGMLVDFDKPAGERCPHQRHGKGCTIYNTRPFGCRYWNCRWLVNDDTADLPRPDRAHYVIDLMADFITIDDGGEPVNIEVVQVWVDKNYPNAHRDPRLRAYLERRGKEGKIALIRLNESDAFSLWPPSLTDDGQWHEIRGQSCGERDPDERLAGLATTRKVVKAG